MDDLQLWEMLPTCPEESIGIRNIAELMGMSVDRTLRSLQDLESRGARCCKGTLVGNVLRYHYWWRDPDHD